MTNSGLRTVDYASGWSNRIDVAARRAIMTGMSQLTGKVNEMNAEKLGTDTYEVTWHSGARPSHQVWQGKWYTMEELISVCGLGTVTGLNGANCYHDYYPVIPGISVPTYSAEELEELNRKENTPVKYEGKEYTKYEALQRQRRLETTMRAQRQKIKLLQVGEADEDDIVAARCRYRGISQEYTRFSEAMGLPMQRERVTVDGLGNIGQGKWKVDKKDKSDIMNMELHRRVSNKGVFAHLPERMSKKHVRKIAKEFGIDLKGITINIDKNPDLLRINYAGRADAENVGIITFFPNAFKSKEELVRTIFHERQHVLQYKEYGTEVVQQRRGYFEKIAYSSEEEFINCCKGEGKL